MASCRRCGVSDASGKARSRRWPIRSLYADIFSAKDRGKDMFPEALQSADKTTPIRWWLRSTAPVPGHGIAGTVGYNFAPDPMNPDEPPEEANAGLRHRTTEYCVDQV